MELILNIFSAIPTMPLFSYIAGGFIFSFCFYILFNILGVVK